MKQFRIILFLLVI